MKPEIFARESHRGAVKGWDVWRGQPEHDASELIGRVAMRFGDVVAYSPSDAVAWKASMRDEAGAVGQSVLSDDRVAHYRSWAVWHLVKRWESLQGGEADIKYTVISLQEKEQTDA